MPVKRVFAHKIIYSGNEYRNHVAEIADNGEVVLYPFESEIAMTLFYSGTVEVTVSEDLRLEVREIK